MTSLGQRGSTPRWCEQTVFTGLDWTGLDWTAVIKRGLVKRGLVKRGLVNTWTCKHVDL